MSLVFRSEVFKIAYNYMDAQSTNLFCNLAMKFLQTKLAAILMRFAINFSTIGLVGIMFC